MGQNFIVEEEVTPSKEWRAEMEKTVDITYSFLEKLKSCGYPYKRLSKIKLVSRNAPIWIGKSNEEGWIEIDPSKHDACAVAHEIGHGFHEKLRDIGKKDDLGEKFADAIRYYVEKEINTNLKWMNEFKINENPFTANYCTFEKFMQALKDNSLFGQLNWGNK